MSGWLAQAEMYWLSPTEVAILPSRLMAVRMATKGRLVAT